MMVCGKINSLKITSILQPVRSDVKIGPARAHGNSVLVVKPGLDSLAESDEKS